MQAVLGAAHSSTSQPRRLSSQEHSAGALCHRKKLWLLSADTCGLRNMKLNTPYDTSSLNSEVNPLLNHAAHDW